MGARVVINGTRYKAIAAEIEARKSAQAIIIAEQGR